MSTDRQARAADPELPDEVVGGLYISDIFTASKYLRHGFVEGTAPPITHMLSVVSDHCEEQKWIRRPTNSKIIQKHINISDAQNAELIAHFPEICFFIHEALQAHGSGPSNVLVHCYAGQSRSATAVLAYLTWSRHMAWYEAYSLLESKRAVFWPNTGFLEQLKVWQCLDCEIIEPPMERSKIIKTLDEQHAAMNALYIAKGLKPRGPREGDDDWHTDAYWALGAPVIVKALYQATSFKMKWSFPTGTRIPRFDALLDIKRPEKPKDTTE